MVLRFKCTRVEDPNPWDTLRHRDLNRVLPGVLYRKGLLTASLEQETNGSQS